MPFTDITPLPTAPQRDDDPDTFVERADDFVAALPDLVTQINQVMAELEATAALIAAAPAIADPGLTAMTGNTPAADKLIYFTGAATSALATLTTFARTLLAAVDASAARTALGLGTAATQASTAFDAAGSATAAVAALTGAGDPFPQYLLESAVSAFIQSLLDDPDAATARATLGVSAISLSGNSASGYIDFGVVKLGWTDATISANGSTSVNAPFNAATLLKAFLNGGRVDTGASENNPFVQSATTGSPGSASVFSATDVSVSATVYFIGI